MDFRMEAEYFPHRRELLYLAFCGVSPLYDPARKKAAEFERQQSLKGSLLFESYPSILENLHDSAAELLFTTRDNISFMKNTSEGISLIAAGYPFRPGDEILSYTHEYPANHYPWRLAELLHRDKGVRLRLLGDNPGILKNIEDFQTPDGPSLPGPVGFSLEDLEEAITPATRIVALSHVQFTSGYALDLPAVGEICRNRGVDLVLDGAQSLGAMAVHPEESGVAAVAASGWKWLLGPIGSGLLYTSPEFRAKIHQTAAGAGLMKQGMDYLNHAWDPHTDGRRFEYSTTSLSHAIALDNCIREVALDAGPSTIHRHIVELQNRFLENLTGSGVRALRFDERHRSGILSLVVPQPEAVAGRLRDCGIVVSPRGGYLRVAPHIPVTMEDMDRAAEELLRVLREQEQEL